MANISFLGTGLIGGAMAEAACARGESVTVWNRSVEKARALERFGAKVASSPASAVAGADSVHIALSDDASVDAIVAQITSAVGGALVVDHTTTSPAGAKARGESLAAKGVAFLHAPIFMSPQMAREAKGVILASGPRAIFERAEPTLSTMTGALHYVGERRELAAAYKLFGNAMIITMTAGLADVFAMAKALDITPSDAQKVFGIFNPANSLGYRGKTMGEGNYDAAFELTMARKDARLMIETAPDRVHLLPAIAAWMDELIARGHGQDDMGVLAIDSVPRR